MKHSTWLALLFVAGPLAVVACASDGDSTGGQGGDSGEGGAGASGPGPTSSSSATGGGGSGGAGGAGGAAGSYCPTVSLANKTPVTYDGSTVGKANIVTSARLEWTDAGDDALLFIAPETATYKISMPVTPAGGACGASIREYGPQMNGMGEIYSSSWCPKEGATVEIDGVFAAGEGFDTDVMLTQGQEMLVWVSCSYFSNPLEGAYQVLIQKL